MYSFRFQPFGYRNNFRYWNNNNCNNTCNNACNTCNNACNTCNNACNTCNNACNTCNNCNTAPCSCPCSNACNPCGTTCTTTCGTGNCCSPNCCQAGCNSNCNVPFCNRPLCPAPYCEGDYIVSAIDELLCEYIEVEKKADNSFTIALVKLQEAIECMNHGLACNKEGYVIWIKIEEWLKRYYQRFGVYCGCLERMEAIRECVRKLLLLERTSLEQTICACESLQESRTLDAELQLIKIEFKNCCVPKC